MTKGPDRRRPTFGRAFSILTAAFAVTLSLPAAAQDEGAPTELTAEDKAQIVQIEQAGEILTAAVAAFGKGDMAAAEAGARQALDGVDDFLPGDNNLTLLARFYLGAALVELSRYADAQPVLEQLDKDIRTAAKPEGVDLGLVLLYRTRNSYWLDRRADSIAQGKELEAWVRTNVGTDGARYAVAQLEYGAASMLAGHPADAEKQLRPAADLFWKQTDPSERASSIRAMTYLGRVVAQQGRLPEADTILSAAVTRAESLFGPDRIETASPLADRAQNLTNMSRFPEAGTIFERVLKIELATYGADSVDVAATRNNIALNLEAQGRFEEAAPLFEAARAAYVRLFGADHQQSLLIATNAATNASSRGDFAGAEQRFAVLLSAARALGADNPLSGIIQSNYAIALAGTGKLSDAEAMERRAIGVLTATVGDRHPQTINAYQTLATVMVSRGKGEAAIPIFQRALQLAVALLGRDHQQVSLILTNMCENFAALGAAKEAEPLARAVLGIEQKIRGPDGVYVAKAHDLIATMVAGQQRYAEAVPEYGIALTMLEKSVGADHPLVARTALNLAGALRQSGQAGEADRLFRRAIAIRERTLSADHFELMAAYGDFGSFLLHGRADGVGAMAPLRRAGSILQRLAANAATDDAARGNFERSRSIFFWEVAAAWQASGKAGKP